MGENLKSKSKVITTEDLEKNPQECDSEKCKVKIPENMIQCAFKECGNVYHFSCAKVDEKKIETMEPFYCKTVCIYKDDLCRQKKKNENFKALLKKAMVELGQAQESLKKKSDELAECEKKNEILEKETIRIPALEEENRELKAKLQEAEDQHDESDDDEDSIDLEFLSDDELKKSMSMFKKKRTSSPKKPKKQVNHMSEAEKLTYYQRLHIQRLEVSKLMKYGGDPAEWLSFEKNFERVRDKGEYDNEAMIEKLRDALIGDAERYVKQRLNQPYADADNIVEVLKKKFFQPKEAVANALAKIEAWKPITEKCRKEIESLLFEIDNYIYLCETLKFQPELEVTINSRVTSKLPYDFETKWQQKISEKKIKGNFKEMSAFLWKLVQSLPLRDARTSQDDASKRIKAAVHVVSGENSKSHDNRDRKENRSCWLCGEDKSHLLRRCDEFRKLSYEDKLKFLAKKKICTRCLSSNQHAALNCPAVARLPPCKRKNCTEPKSHTTVMHKDAASGAESSSSQRLLHVGSMIGTLFKVVPVYVFDGQGNKVETTLLMDRGASASLVNKKFFNQLGIEGRQCHLELSWLQPDANHPDTKAIRHDLRIAPIHKPDRVFTLHGMSALDGVMLPFQEQDAEQLVREYPYLRDAKIPSFKRQRPQILLGLPHSRLMVSLETIMDEGQQSAPIAEKSPLGWTVSGSDWSSKSIFHICEGSSEECQHEDVMGQELETLRDLHETIKYFHSFDIMGIDDRKREYLCRDDKTALQILRYTMRQVGNRYEIGLYWRHPDCVLPDNYDTALKRLATTEKRLKKLDMVQWANEHQKLLRDSGFVRKATEDDLSPATPHKRVNYVIGFITFNENKMPPKPRWVVDTASKHYGVSLNSQLLKGPDNLIPLTQALFHFRERAVATVGDVTKMYHQILIKKEDQQCQRFLWRDCDESKAPTIYIFQTMLFGPTCSPSQANSVRLDVAMKLEKKFPHGSRAARMSMYMDDEFNSEDTPEEAARTANETIQMFKTISWDSVGFKSNCEVALKLLPQENVDNELVKDLCSEDEILSRKVLGLSWNPKSDTFSFRTAKNVDLISHVLNDDYRPTKLEVLSFVMKIFDCLGLIAHFVIRGRMILQSIWRCGIGWHEKMPDDIFDAFRKWLEKFEEIEKLEIPRHYGLDSRTATEYSLQICVDASPEAYSCTVHIRFKMNGKYRMCLAMAKCRVTPVKYTSVPNAELMAAVIGAKAYKTVEAQHPRIKFERVIFWSDSITVLRWLYAPNLKLKQFVAPRVAEIQDLTNVNDWRYIESALNVADDGTKWNDINFSSPNQRWLRGPEFLYRDETEWPAKFPANVNLAEHRVMVAALRENNDQGTLYYAGIVEGVSSKVRASWEHYRMVIAWVRRFINNMRAKISKRKGNNAQVISPQELREAEHFMFKRIQAIVFKEEKLSLTKGRNIKMSSKLFQLNAYLDKDGLIRSKTRMCMESSIPYDMRCPPILPNKHESVHAFLVYLHEKNMHVGVEGVAAEARSQTWIIHVRGAVQRVKSDCLYCLDQKIRQQIPPTAPLPSFRVTPTSSAFEHCGVDCAGPFTIYSGRSKRKRDVWIVIFTCMVTRAVYLRKLDAMTADEMLLAIQDIWTRRGPIRHMHSDNGRNFIGAARIIKANHLQQLANEKKLTWHFIPALTPQWGGAWERLIRDVKRAMKAEFRGKTVGEKVFECVLLQVEDMMNSRPLTHLPVSPDDLMPLTPNYLVKLHPGYSFVQGEAQADDDESRLYARRARTISEKLVSRWVKEYLHGISQPKQKGQSGKGLEVGDFVVYTDPTVKPSNWKRGVVVNTYKGRDGYARVADVKVAADEFLMKRSVQRLAKLEIDENSFRQDKATMLSTFARYDVQPQGGLRESDSCSPLVNNVLYKFRKIISFFAKMAKSSKLGLQSTMRLWNELGTLEFHSKADVKERESGTTTTIGEILEVGADKDNSRTVKINRIPSTSNWMELLSLLGEMKWDFEIVAVDSIAQEAGVFGFVTFRSPQGKKQALELGSLKIRDRDCRITEPYEWQDPLSRKRVEFALICWHFERTSNCVTILARSPNAANKDHAFPRFSGIQVEEYREYIEGVTHCFSNLVSQRPRPRFRNERDRPVFESDSDSSSSEDEPATRRLKSVVNVVRK